MAPEVRGVLWTLLLTIVIRSVVDCKNVVFLPFMVTSHARVHGIVAAELAEFGHNVWCAVPSALEKRKTDVLSTVTTFSYFDFIEENEDIIITKIENSIQDMPTNPGHAFDWLTVYEDYISEHYFRALKAGKLVEYIASLKPDLIVIDFYPRTNEFVAIPYILDVPFAILSALRDPVVERSPFNPYADMYNSRYFRTEASLYEQLITVMKSMYPLVHDLLYDRGYIQTLAPLKPAVSTAELMTRAEVYIIESDHILNYATPTLPNVKFVGGISAAPATDLQEPFNSFIERSEKAGKGIAVLSFGSLFLNMTKDLEMKLVAVITRIKLNVIWRSAFVSPDPTKILTSLWLPQNSLLGNKNIRVFISHCGTHSQYEALYHAVPLLCLPLFFDQVYNTERVQEKGYGIGANVFEASTEDIASLVHNVANNETIRMTIKTASEIYHSQFTNPKYQAAFWLDHVMKYGGSYMRYSGQKMPLYLYAVPEFIYFFLGSVFAFSVTLLVLLLTLVGCRSCSKSKHLKQE